jgi:RHS repeat-associated protein
VEVDDHVLLAGTRIVSVRPSRTLYYYRSRLGTVVATSVTTSTQAGVLGAQYRYDPYGKVQVALNETATTASELGYTNGLRLSGSLLYLKARVYDAEARVFLQADSVDRYRYAYVWGDPVNLSDPTGLAPIQGQVWGKTINAPQFKSLSEVVDYAQQQTAREAAKTTSAPTPTPVRPIEEASGTANGIGLAPSKKEEKDAPHSPPQKAEGGERDAEVSIIVRLRAGTLVAVDSTSGETVSMRMTSGRGTCTNRPECAAKKSEGPAPPNDYQLNTDEISRFSMVGSMARFLAGLGDWGSFRVPLHSTGDGQMYERDGIFLHGGSFPGSAGCVDVGGGFGGSPDTMMLLRMLYRDADGIVPLRILP